MFCSQLVCKDRFEKQANAQRPIMESIRLFLLKQMKRLVREIHERGFSFGACFADTEVNPLSSRFAEFHANVVLFVMQRFRGLYFGGKPTRI